MLHLIRQASPATFSYWRRLGWLRYTQQKTSILMYLLAARLPTIRYPAQNDTGGRMGAERQKSSLFPPDNAFCTYALHLPFVYLAQKERCGFV